jgi:regulatory protein YycI of two-component signal transduction system YycFG
MTIVKKLVLQLLEAAEQEQDLNLAAARLSTAASLLDEASRGLELTAARAALETKSSEQAS